MYTEFLVHSQFMRVVLVSPSHPRQSGIANYTADLITALRAEDSRIRCRIAAIDEPNVVRPYGSEVGWRIRQRDPESYRLTAEALSTSDADVVSVQYDFDYYGVCSPGDYHRGLYEDHLRPFLESLTKPTVTTLHSLVSRPSPTVRDAIRIIEEYSNSIVVMSESAVDLLVNEYGVKTPPTVIHHGFPAIKAGKRLDLKKKLGLSDRTIVSTFGLIQERKGIEYMIRALPAIIAQHPRVLYLVAGVTSAEEPGGDEYRNHLLSLIDRLGIAGHVAFVNQHLNQYDLTEYLLATDVYVAPHVDLDQITSGTLSYAIGAGKAIVSTRFSHAVEMLADGRGILIDSENSEQLADSINKILGDPSLKETLETSTKSYASQLTWSDSAKQFRELFDDVAKSHARPRPERRDPYRPRDVGLGVRVPENPLITPADVTPSLPEFEVVSSFNAAAAKVDDEIILLLRVAERPRSDIDPAPGAMTVDVNAPVPRLQPLRPGMNREQVIGISILDTEKNPPQVAVVYLPKDLPGLDITDSRSVRFRGTAGGFTPGVDDYSQYLTQMSHLRVARSKDGVKFTIDEHPAISPINRFEEYGVEDPRATLIDGIWHVTYVAVSHIGITTHRLTTTDFRTFNREGMMFLPDHKDVVLFPEKVGGKYAALTRPMPQSFGHVHGIWIAFSDDLVNWGGHQPLALPRWGRWDEIRTGASAVPFRVKEGWLELYHGVDRNTRYTMGALLMDAEDPTKVIGRSPRPILVPSEPFEKTGFFNDTVLSCGHVALDDENEHIRLYYGAADTVTAAADFFTRDIIDHLEPA